MSPETLFKSVADGTRLGILQVLMNTELAVNELEEVLDLPQSTVSRHLKTLKDAGFVQVRHHGTSATYFPAPDGNGAAGGLRKQLADWARSQELPETTARRLREVHQRRRGESNAFFAGITQRWDQLRLDFFGGAFHLEALLSLLPKSWVVADVGTGTGYLLPVLGRLFSRVIAVDTVPEMLDAARQRATLAGLRNVDIRRGEAAELPIPRGEIDLCIASLMLHHEPAPAEALAEFRRVIRPGGRLLVIEQKAHQHQAFYDLMQDRWWGFAPDELVSLAEEAGFVDVNWQGLHTASPGSTTAPHAPGLFALTARQPAKALSIEED